MRKMLKGRRDGEGETLPWRLASVSSGAPVHACAAVAPGSALERAGPCGGGARGALEEKDRGKDEENECGEGGKIAPSPLFINGRGRSWARDLLRTISVTVGE